MYRITQFILFIKDLRDNDKPTIHITLDLDYIQDVYDSQDPFSWIESTCKFFNKTHQNYKMTYDVADHIEYEELDDLERFIEEEIKYSEKYE